MRVLMIGLLVAAGVFSPGCDHAGNRVTEPSLGVVQAFRTVDTGSCLEVVDRHGAIFRSAAEWAEFWNAHVVCTDQVGKPIAPPAFPDGEMIVATFWGDGYSGCSNALGETIESVRLEGGLLVVEIGPLPKPDVTCTALVYPMHVIATPSTGLPVVFDWP